MEATSYRKLAPACWLFTSPCPKRLGQETWNLMNLQLGEVPTVVVSSPEIAKEVMKMHDITFATRPYVIASRIISYDSTDIAFAPYGEYWRQMRKICTLELLSTKRVLSFRSIRDEEVSNLVRFITSNARSPIYLNERIHSSTYGIASRAAFRKKSKDQETFISIIKESIEEAAGFNLADIYPSAEWLHLISGIKSQLEKLHKEADRILENIINDHKVDKATNTGKGRVDEDLVVALLEYHEHGTNGFSLTIHNIKAVILDMFSAGSETSATAVDWAMSEMMKTQES